MKIKRRVEALEKATNPQEVILAIAVVNRDGTYGWNGQTFESEEALHAAYQAAFEGRRTPNLIILDESLAGGES